MSEVQPIQKSASDPLAKTWANPDAARIWLKRNPQPGLIVKFIAGEFRLVPGATVDPEQIEADVPESAQEPAVELPAMPADPTNGLLVSDALICIGGLPDDSTAYTWAKEIARKLNMPIVVREASGGYIGTIDSVHLAAVKAASAKLKKKTGSGQSRASKTQPDGKRMQVIELCMREQGASTRELVELTGWHKCPWRWTIGSNKNGTGLCDRYNYGFRSEKVDGEVRYFLTPAQALAA